MSTDRPIRDILAEMMRRERVGLMRPFWADWCRFDNEGGPEQWRLRADHLIRLLMDRSFRNEQLARINPDVAAHSRLGSIEREYTLEEISIMTRAGPARVLGLRDRGHLRPGAVADVVVYDDLPDREAMFALGMMRIAGRGGPANREEGARLLAASAKLGKAAAAYNLGLLYLEGQIFPQDIKRAAELFRQAADAGNPEAQYALATFYKEGRGVEKNLAEAARLMRLAAMADNLDAEVEYAIALFNGTGTPKDVPTAVALLTRAARQNSPIAQNRLARILVDGMGVPVDKVNGFKWHLIAKTAGNGDPDLDARLAELSPEDRKKAEDAAKRWFGGK